MSSIVTIMGLTNYNPYKEAITALVGGAGPYLINWLTLKPTSLVSKIDRIRETLFGMRTRLLELTQKNALTKYTWLVLKHTPASLALSHGLFLLMYFIARKEMMITKDVIIYTNCAKYLTFLLSLGAFIYDELNPLPPRDSFKPRHRRETSYYVPTRLDYSGGGYKDSRRPSEATLGKKSPLSPSNPGGFKSFK